MRTQQSFEFDNDRDDLTLFIEELQDYLKWVQVSPVIHPIRIRLDITANEDAVGISDDDETN